MRVFRRPCGTRFSVAMAPGVGNAGLFSDVPPGQSGDLVSRNHLDYRGFELVRAEAERSGPAFVSYPTRSIDEIKAVRPCGVRTLGRVAKFVEHGGNLDSQLAHARSGHEPTFLFTVRTGEDDLVFDIALRLPDVGRVRLGDVDHEERNLAPVLLIELVEGRNLPPEGRSGVAPKNQHHRAILCAESGKLYGRGLVDLHQREVRGGTAYLQRSRPGAHPECFKGKNQKRNRPRDFGHHSGKVFRRLPHHAIQSYARQHPQRGDHAEGYDRYPGRLGFYVHAIRNRTLEQKKNAPIIGQHRGRSIVGK